MEKKFPQQNSIRFDNCAFLTEQTTWYKFRIYDVLLFLLFFFVKFAVFTKIFRRTTNCTLPLHSRTWQSHQQVFFAFAATCTSNQNKPKFVAKCKAIQWKLHEEVLWKHSSSIQLSAASHPESAFNFFSPTVMHEKEEKKTHKKWKRKRVFMNRNKARFMRCISNAKIYLVCFTSRGRK